MVNHHVDGVEELEAKKAESIQQLVPRNLVEHLCEDSHQEKRYSIGQVSSMILDVVDVVGS